MQIIWSLKASLFSIPFLELSDDWFLVKEKTLEFRYSQSISH